MTNEQSAKLSRIQNCATRYEIVAIAPNGSRALVGYTARKSKIGFIEAVRKVGKEACDFINLSDTDEAPITSRGMKFKSGAFIGFSGRTQRDAILNGELTFVGSGAA